MVIASFMGYLILLAKAKDMHVHCFKLIRSQC